MTDVHNSLQMAYRLADNIYYEKTGCWLWTGRTDRSGYGELSFNGKHLKAHRFAWEMANGPIPKGDGYHGTCVCHICDNPICINPQHLFLGSQADNLRDMKEKGRQPRGETHWASDLTDQQVAQIKSLLAAGQLQRRIAKQFNVSQPLISMISSGKRWAHVKT